VEGGREEVGEGAGDGCVGGAGVEDGGGGWGEFGDGLAAGSAGLADGLVEIVDGDGADADGGAELGDGGGDRGLFGAGGEAVGGVFDVASGDDFAALEQNGGSDEEAAVGGVGAVGGGLGEALQLGEAGGSEGLVERGHVDVRVLRRDGEGKGWGAVARG